MMVAKSERIEPPDESTRIGGIDYPNEVIRALLERRLVVFAGAGVSMDSPTSLPSFEGLIREIEQLTRRKRSDGESHDMYLGRIADDLDFNVRGVVANLLSKEDSRPNNNHLNLLRLFGCSDNVRLVTTNFDSMLEQACGPLGWAVDSFTAPVLPAATDFNGIVHLHGSLDAPERMVLTDADFGKAYMIEGWAKRFLEDLVRRHTVLFVGYSSNDLILRYLLTAIRDASAGRLFSLHPSGEKQAVERIGINPIPYGPELTVDHSILARSLERLGRLFSLAPDEWRSEIESVVAMADPFQLSEDEVVRLALQMPETTRYFVVAADRISWIRWLEENGYLSSVFSADALTPSEEFLAHLVARLCIRDDPSYLLRLLERQRYEMSEHLWQQLIFAICGNETIDVSFGQWVTILLQQPVECMDGDALSSLAGACDVRGDAEALLLVYEFLVTPRRVGSQHGWSGFDEHVKITEDTVDQSGGSLALHHCANMLETQDASIHRQALEIGIRSFEQRHKLLRFWGKSSDDCDPWSTVYDPINRPDGREQPEGFDLLCLVTRQQIHSVVNSGGDYVDDLVRRLVTSPAPILRRLAVDAVRVREDVDAEGKADWLMRRTRLSDVELVTEVSRLLTQIFADLSDDSQERLVAWLLDGEARQASDVDVVDAKKSGWLRLLKRSDPNSKTVERELRGLRRHSQKAFAHPYRERSISIGEAGFIHHPEPFTVDELLNAPASAWVDKLVTWQRPGGCMWDDERHGLLTNVRLACVRNFGWSKDLARGLIDRDNSSTDLWGAILTAWRDESCAVADWSSVIEALTFVSGNSDLSSDIAFALVRFAKGAQGLGLFERANCLAAAMWRENSDDAEGWLSNGALVASWNSAAGQIPMYWVEVAKRLIVGSLESELISTKLKSEVSEIVQSSSHRATVGKVTLGAWFHVLLRIDTDWAHAELLPMFGDAHAGFEAAWEGFLWTFQGTIWMPDEMLDNVEAAIANRQLINTEYGVSVARFVSYLCCTRESKLAHRLFEVLCATAADAQSLRYDIANFVIGIRSLLRRMDVQQRVQLWNSWLKEYLARRKDEVPWRLVSGEVWELLMLIPVMLPAVREIADVLIEFPVDRSTRNNFGSIFHNVDVDDFPNEYAKLMLYFDQYELGSWQWNYNKKHIDKLIANESVPLDQRKRLEGLKQKYMID